jgi:hypothetical protein
LFECTNEDDRGNASAKDNHKDADSFNGITGDRYDIGKRGSDFADLHDV